MTKKSPAKKEIYQENERALRELSGFKHRDLQLACILRGLEPHKIVEFDHHKLVSWFIEHYNNSQDNTNIAIHDAWVEEQLQSRGYKKGDILLSPALRFGYVGNIETMDKPKVIKTHGELNIPGKKEKSVIDEKTGIRSGTKKALSYKLATEGLQINEIIKQVKSKFPDAEEKSIKIWVKRSLKLITE